MAQYWGEPCPVCKKKFKEGDDIVVCPECGTPYHRACWEEVGHCVHEAEHAAGFEWKPSLAEGPAEAVCPNCGTHNPAGATYCNHCGVPLPRPGAQPQPKTGPDAGPVYAREQSGYRPRRPENEPRMTAYAAGRDGGIYRREIGPDDPIDGIKARDWASFVGRSSSYYLMQFFRMSETRRKLGLSFSVLLFGPAYYFYRKMWREGAFYAVLSLVFAVPNALLLLMDAGVVGTAGWNISLLSTMADVCYIASLILSVVMCLFAVYLYKQAAAKRIQDIYARVPEGPDRADALAMTGGTSLLAAVVYLSANLILTGYFMTLLGPYVQTLLYGITL